jgi:hypothetical protein
MSNRFDFQHIQVADDTENRLHTEVAAALDDAINGPKKAPETRGAP